MMVGAKGGLATLLKRQNPSLISVHCVCHRLALACADANSELKCISDMELTLFQLWKLFHYSPKKLACFTKSLVEYRKMIIVPKSRKKVGKLLKRACKTRWLSFEASIVAVFEDYIPVLQTLNKLESDATAFGLLKKMNKVLFLGLVYILYFVLPILARVSRIFQKGFVSFAIIGPTLESAKFELNSLAEDNKPIKLLETELASGGRLGTLEIEITDHAKGQLENKVKNYVLEQSKNFDRRFPDVPLLQSFSIFDPTAVPDKLSPAFKIHGIEEIKVIHNHFFGESPIILDELLAEYTLLKFHMLKWKGEIDQECAPTEWCLLKMLNMKFEFQQLCPNLIKIAESVVALPVSNAWPERGASKVKLIKTSARNLLKNDMLQGLLQIQINGPTLCSESCDELIKN